MPDAAIAFVVSSLGCGGAERVVTLLARALAGRGHRVIVVTLDPTTPDFHAVPAGVERIRVDAAGVSASAVAAVANNLAAVGRLASALRRARPDVVVAFGDTTNVKALLAGRMLGVPVVVSERVDPATVDIGRAWSTLRRVTYRGAAALVVQTEAVAPWARAAIDPRRVAVIANPIELPPVVAQPRETEVVAVGRMVPQKGFDVLLAASARSVPPPWRLTILGDGPDRAALHARAAALGLADRVALPGNVDDVARRLAAAGLFVLASRFEGFPNALCEAMAAGAPVVSTDCPSGPAEILAGVDAPLVPVGDAAALGEAMRAMIDDPARRERVGAQARRRIADFSPAAIANAWADVLARAVARARPAR